MSTATNVDKSRKDLRVRLRPGSVQVLEFQMFMKRKTYCELFRTINSVGDPALSLSTQVDIDVIHVMKWTRPSPLVLHPVSCER